jgi:large subunit ribosomal protein L47
MARVKYVLNERRLGMMAVAQPVSESMSNLVKEIAAGENESVVEDEEVAREEVEARDEGFGGGQEAKDFVDEVKVENGHVEKK